MLSWTRFRFEDLGEIWFIHWNFLNGLLESVVGALVLKWLCICHRRNPSEPNWSAIIWATSSLQLILTLPCRQSCVSIDGLHCSGSKWMLKEFVCGYIECFHCHVFIAIYFPCTDMKYVSKYIFIFHLLIFETMNNMYLQHVQNRREKLWKYIKINLCNCSCEF